MNKLTHAALLAAVVGAAAFAAPAQAADDMKMEKCYGVAKAGENSCASAKGGHSCAGQSKAAFSGQDFKAVAAGTCEKMMGSLTPFEGANPKIKG
jgi:uncharacterized membrane protein